jgi:putative ABC transport system permease protein
LLAGALGLALCRPAAAAVAGLISMGGQPVRLDLAIDAKMLGFVTAISMAAALVSGILPALRATKIQVSARGTTAAPIRRTSGRLAAALQLGLSVVLIGGALLFAFSLHRLTTFDTGIHRSGLTVLDVDFTEAGYKGERSAAASARLLERLRGLPGVRMASYSGNGIYTGRGWNPSARTDTVPKSMAWFDLVGPGYFTALGARIVAGRDISDRDNASAEKVVVVSAEFVKHFFPDGNVLDRLVYLDDESQGMRVVGVVADIRTSVRNKPRAMAYLSHAQRQDGLFTTRYVVRGGTAADLRAAARAEDPGLRVVSIDSADQLLNRTQDLDRVVAALAGAFGLLALTLAAVGVYGMLAYAVARRTSEIGIRMAVGATRGDVVVMVLREAALVASAGIAIGLVAAAALGKLVEGLVFELKPGDPRVLGGAAVLLALVALAAAVGPARRAATMDPMGALRSE